MVDKARNDESMRESIDTLDQIASNPATPKTIKKTITEMVAGLNSDKYALAIRAANAISMLDEITQDPNMPSYVRIQLWQAVSKLEGIRE